MTTSIPPNQGDLGLVTAMEDPLPQLSGENMLKQVTVLDHSNVTTVDDLTPFLQGFCPLSCLVLMTAGDPTVRSGELITDIIDSLCCGPMQVPTESETLGGTAIDRVERRRAAMSTWFVGD